MTIYKSQGCGAFTGSPCGAPNRKPPLSPARPIVTSRSQWSNINGVLNGDLFISYTLTRLVPRGGVKITPPLDFFQILKNVCQNMFFTWTKFISRHFEKKNHANKRLGHSNYVLEVYGGRGDFLNLFSESLFTDRFWYDDVINVNSQNHPYSGP